MDTWTACALKQPWRLLALAHAFLNSKIFAIVHLHSKLHRDQLGMTSNQANSSVSISPSGIIEPYKISTDPVPLCARLDDLRSLEQEMFEQVPKHFLLQTY